jgi:hypothetical protein
MEEEGGYSGIFYVMLIIGIVGVLGFFVVAPVRPAVCELGHDTC